MDFESDENFWRKCSSCKKPINFSTKHYVCNVSTCNQKRTGWVFCAVECWDAHVPKMNHRESWAIEKNSPAKAGWQQARASDAADSAAPISAPAVSTASSKPAMGAKEKPATPAAPTVIRRPRQS
jgi:hypothetical protein